MKLGERLIALRAELAVAAQGVVDDWAQDEEGVDEELGSGGVCDRVAEAMGEVIHSRLDDIQSTEGGQPGDDHAFIIVYDDEEAYAVDIPPGVYETGGGYSWKKIQDAEVEASDVSITKMDRDLIADWD